MPPLPHISGKALIRALEKSGFTVVRQKGSHHQMRHSDGRRTTVPVHGNKDIPDGTLKGILHDIEIHVEQFLELL